MSARAPHRPQSVCVQYVVNPTSAVFLRRRFGLESSSARADRINTWRVVMTSHRLFFAGARAARRSSAAGRHSGGGRAVEWGAGRGVGGDAHRVSVDECAGARGCVTAWAARPRAAQRAGEGEAGRKGQSERIGGAAGAPSVWSCVRCSGGPRAAAILSIWAPLIRLLRDAAEGLEHGPAVTPPGERWRRSRCRPSAAARPPSCRSRAQR